MGEAFSDIDLSNPKRPDLQPVRARALADTGAVVLCIPEHVALQLGFETATHREAVVDGRQLSVPYVGPVQVTFDGRFCFAGALVLGEDVRLGAIPMADIDLVVHPERRKVTVNPKSPNVPQARA